MRPLLETAGGSRLKLTLLSSPVHNITAHCTALRCTLQCSALHCPTLPTVQCNALHCTEQCSALQFTVQCSVLHYTENCSALHCTRKCSALQLTVQCTLHCAVQCSAVCHRLFLYYSAPGGLAPRLPERLLFYHNKYVCSFFSFYWIFTFWLIDRLFLMSAISLTCMRAPRVEERMEQAVGRGFLL